METTKYCGEPRHSVHRGSLALGGTQTDSSSVSGRLLVAKAAPEPDTDRRNLRSRGSHELGPIGANRRARGSQRPCLGILAKCSGFIAQEAPPRLGWPSARCRQITRDGGLGNGEPQHEKLTVDLGRTPEKVLPGHLSDQIAHLPTRGRPPRQRPDDRYRQSANQPLRRQRKTVSG